mmetsp:Transcript_1025/g.4195  ORF Transcript_1025/g.4195 Transcript_1025/m.4195 type:complete len:402 (+) Transcript_1025:1421-2626(+)
MEAGRAPEPGEASEAPQIRFVWYKASCCTDATRIGYQFVLQAWDRGCKLGRRGQAATRLVADCGHVCQQLRQPEPAQGIGQRVRGRQECSSTLTDPIRRSEHGVHEGVSMHASGRCRWRHRGHLLQPTAGRLYGHGQDCDLILLDPEHLGKRRAQGPSHNLCGCQKRSLIDCEAARDDEHGCRGVVRCLGARRQRSRLDLGDDFGIRGGSSSTTSRRHCAGTAARILLLLRLLGLHPEGQGGGGAVALAFKHRGRERASQTCQVRGRVIAWCAYGRAVRSRWNLETVLAWYVPSIDNAPGLPAARRSARKDGRRNHTTIARQHSRAGDVAIQASSRAPFHEDLGALFARNLLSERDADRSGARRRAEGDLIDDMLRRRRHVQELGVWVQGDIIDLLSCTQE